MVLLFANADVFAGALLLLFANAAAYGPDEHRRVNHGLIGYGIPFLEPSCAYSCSYILRSNRLDCSTPLGGDADFDTSANCRASNDVFLQSLALCLQTYCNSTEAWILERFWMLDAASDTRSQPKPAYGFEQALDKIYDSPTEQWPFASIKGTLETASRVSVSDWTLASTSLQDDAFVERQHSRSGIILFVVIALVPVVLALLRALHISKTAERQIVARFGHQALFGQRHAVPMKYDIGIIPTRGQAVFIALLVILNVVLLLTGYHASEPNLHGVSAGRRMRGYIANRAGVLSFANFSLMMITCSRNNLVVRFSKFSYSTMLLYHRWVAYMCMGHASVHAGIYLVNHIDILPKKFGQAYWNWGFLAATLMLLTLPLSSLPFRKRFYELFLDTHILIAALIFTGTFYHIYMNYQHEFGYENWVYLAVGIWLFDRLLRLLKLLRNGVKTAHVTQIDADYARIDIPDMRLQGHAFLYFPTLSWRFWQNHPFSIISSVHEDLALGMEQVYGVTAQNESKEALHQGQEWHTLALDDDEAEEGDDEKNLLAAQSSRENLDGQQGSSASALEAEKRSESQDLDLPEIRKSSQHTSGARFYIRRQRGITARIFNAVTVPVLVEGPYHPLPIPDIATCPTLLCIAGGVGITAVLPPLRAHALVGGSHLYWTCRSEALVEDVDLSALRSAGVVSHVKTTGRWDVGQIVLEECAVAMRQGDVIVMVSGPNSLADDVRKAVVRANLEPSRRNCKGRVRLVEESFSW